MQRVVLSVLVILFLGGGFLLLFWKLPEILESKIGVLQVRSTPVSTVFLNDKHLGKTSLKQENIALGEYHLKMVPESGSSGLMVFQNKITINSQTTTVVNVDFEDKAEPNFTILTMNKISDKRNAEISVISIPENGRIFLDGIEKGQTPLLLSLLPAQDFNLNLKLAGFDEKKLALKTTLGYRLNANIKLKELSTQSNISTTSSSASSSAQVIAAKEVEILETGLGFLRVRLTPSLSASETARVKPGEKYPYFEEKSGWIKIKYSGKEGWVKSEYVKKLE